MTANTENNALQLEKKSNSASSTMMLWLFLITLTVLTVSISGLDFGRLTFVVISVIIGIESLYVFKDYMKVKVSDGIFIGFLLVVVLLLTIVFALI